MPNEDSLKKRYVYKLSTNLVGLGIGLATLGLVPRGLGPKLYGDYSYLTNFFTQFIGFFDMGTSACFYTKLSQRQDDKGLVTYYLYFIFLVVFISLSFIAITSVFNLEQFIWPEESIFFIFLAAIWGVLDWIFRIFNQISDAYGLTVITEKMKIVQKLIGMILILGLFYSHQLYLDYYFYYQYFILIFVIIAIIIIIKRKEYYFKSEKNLNRNQVKSYTKEFWVYSSPLLIVSLFGVIISLFDRWFLQIYGGSTQQGLFGLSSNISAICLTFTTAMTPLLQREFSISFANKDIPQMANLFRRYIPMLYSIVAYFSCFVALQADKVALIFGGKNFKEASFSMVIMAFYPLHQTYGQLTGSVFYATGQTKLYRNISIISNALGIPLLYFFIAPVDKFGLDAGAVGLAGKMLILSVFTVNVLLYYSTRFLQITYWKYLFHQVFSLGVFLLLSYSSRFLIDEILYLKHEILVSFLISGFIYSMLIFMIAYYQPMIFGLSKENISSIFSQGRDKFLQILRRK